MPPEKWNNAFSYCEKELSSCAVPGPDDSLLFLERARILPREEPYQAGQVVEILAGKEGGRIIKLGLVQLEG